MYCLSIDTSSSRLVLVLSRDGKVVVDKYYPLARKLETSLIKAIDRLLHRAQCKLNQIECFGVGIGPGSFTSLRVGCALMKAMAFVGGQKIIGLSSLDLIAQGLKGASCDRLLVVIDARRGQVYSAAYKPNGEILSPAALLPWEAISFSPDEKIIVVGDAVKLYGEKWLNAHANIVLANEHLWWPDAKAMVAMVHARIQAGQCDDPMTLVPHYLYAQDCQVSTVKKGQS